MSSPVVTSRSHLTPLVLAIQLALPLLATALTAPLAHAESARFHIPAGSLDDSLKRFAQQSGIAILYPSTTVKGLAAPALEGEYETEDGLARLLAGSGYRAQAGEHGYRLVALDKSAALELDSTSVISNQLGTITEGSGSYTPGTIATATRLVLTPRQTPQTISVVTRQEMDDFGLNAIDDVMRHTPGITVSTYDSERSMYYSRGFPVQNFQYDGIPTLRNDAYSAGNTLSDTAIYDRVEVIKGASGLLSGAGAPGATINLIRKKPTHEFAGHMTLGAGSWDNYRSELDLSGPLNDSGSIRGRAVAAYQDKHSFQDHYERKISTYYGILEMDLSEDTLLTLGADYQDNDPKGSTWGGVPLFDSNGDFNEVSRSFNPGAQWSSWAQYTRSAFASLEHHFANDWMAKAQVNHQINGYHAVMGSASGGNPNPQTGTGATMFMGKYVGETRTDTAEVYSTGPFTLFGREHELVVGASASRAVWDGKGWYDNQYKRSVDNFYEWNGDVPVPNWGSPFLFNDQTTRQTGSYITARFKPTDDLALIVGSRFADYSLSGDTHSKETGHVVPYAGAVYDLNDNFSLYASYTSIFKPQTLPDRTNKPLEPNEGDNYEVGIKGEFYDGRLNASLAWFEIKEDNRAEADLDYNATPNYPGLGYAYVGTKAKTKGIEAEISGELAPGWQAQAGYTHKIIRNFEGEKISTWEPQDQFSFYTSYRLPGALSDLTVGGGARWQSKSWQAVTNPVHGAQDVTQEAYWLVDLMTRYQISDNLSASVNLNNLLDKKYFTNVGFYNTVYYGDPRNLMFSTRWDF
ncbi:MAG: TonB-dependent siderophore receptor [Pseudomonas putida]|jgi:outer membrane receptor for ferric coprogen and ferric-rhodotorulic acid|nr:TonB-dependent siderophore receptor [Pseudomonas putida]